MYRLIRSKLSPRLFSGFRSCFIGSHLAAELLSLGAEVSVLDDLSTGHVRNMIEGLFCITAGSRFEGEVYNVPGDEVISIRELAERICNFMGVEPEFAYSGSVRPGDTQRWTADIGRLRSFGPPTGCFDERSDPVRTS